MTREVIPVRVWCWPGNTNDNSILPQVKDDLRAWRLGRVVTMVDRGFSSDANLACLLAAAHPSAGRTGACVEPGPSGESRTRVRARSTALRCRQRSQFSADAGPPASSSLDERHSQIRKGAEVGATRVESGLKKETKWT